MLHSLRRNINPKQHLRWITVFILIICMFALALSNSTADVLQQRELKINTSDASATAQYRLSFILPSSITYGSLEIQFCSNDPLPRTPCTTPPGLDISGAILSSQTGVSGFTIAPGATSNKLVLTRTPGVVPAGTTTYIFDNIINPSAAGTYYVRLLTFPTSDASGPKNNEGGAAIAIINSVSVKATVPPYITFCTGITIQNFNCATASGDYIDFGELSYRDTRSASSQMLAASNAQSGYTLSMEGTTMTSGTNEIAALASGDVSRPGTSQFGLNLTANSTPPSGAFVNGPGTAQPVSNYGTSDVYRFKTGETLSSTTAPDDVRVFTVSYIVNVPQSQPPGIYVTTITYICLATF